MYPLARNACNNGSGASVALVPQFLFHFAAKIWSLTYIYASAPAATKAISPHSVQIAVK
jgi:hypothetical protein